MFCTKVYPLKASNGSTIILYGHSHGLRIVWRGGTPLKKVAPKGDGEATSSAERRRSSEGIDPELDQASTHLQDGSGIIQDMDLTFETEVYSIALPPINSRPRHGAPSPAIFEKNMVFAVACGDSSVKAISVPLEAPQVDTKETLGKLPPEKFANVANVPAGPKSHGSPASSIALTWTARTNTQPAASQNIDNLEWDLLLASAGLIPSSVLFLTRIPLVCNKGHHAVPKATFTPFQRLNLSSQTVSLAFSTATCPAKRHTQLLIAERNGHIHIYDFAGDHIQQSSADSDGDSAMSVSTSTRGSWVAGMTTSYQTYSSAAADLVSPALARPKPLLAAEWVLEGRSVLLLTSDGETGLWDIESDRPSELRLRSSLSSGKGGSTSESTRETRGGLAPMTPNTRAVKAQRLFSSPTTGMNIIAPPRGGLEVTSRKSQQGDESVILWYGENVYSIANFKSYATRNDPSNRSAGSLFGSGLARIDGLNLRGEMITSTSQLPLVENSRESHSHADIVVSADSRIIVLSRQSTATPFVGSSALIRQPVDEEMEDAEDDRTDMELLSREELGLAGIEKLANNMSGTTFGRSAGRKVLFAPS